MGLGKLFSALFVLNSQQKSESVNMTVRFAPDSSSRKFGLVHSPFES